MGEVLKSLFVVRCLLFVACACLTSCTSAEEPTQQQVADHQKDIDTWYAKRVEDLKSHDGWLNLAGLFWLNEGINSFGSDENNDLVFPLGKITARAGYFMVKDGRVSLIPSKDAEMTIYGQPVTGEVVVFHPDSARAIKQLAGSVTKRGPLEWFIITRDGKMGLRLRDLDSDAVKNFPGIERYPVDYSWKVKAKFEPAEPGSTINITNVLGQTTPQELGGVYSFELNGKEHRLSATGTDKKLFVVFADSTTGKETYPSGRFIYIDRPDSTGVAFIDFNKSYNPPCAFTAFATCPLPPKENVLSISIKAGEKNYDYEKQTASTVR
jgi:uncharacterized protein (DUF1684 family)